MEFEPYAYAHAARLINATPSECAYSKELLVAAHSHTIEQYDLAHCVCGIDVYTPEAEAMGCKVTKPADGRTPVIRQPACHALEEIPDLDFQTNPAHRLDMILESALLLKDKHPNCKVYVPIAGPFSVTAELFGIENLICALLMQPEETKKALNHVTELLEKRIETCISAGLEIALFESSVTPPLLAPEQFENDIAPLIKRLIKRGKQGTLPQLIVGGDTLSILPAMVATGSPYLICPAETDQEAFVKAVANSCDVKIRFNLSPQAFETPTREMVANLIQLGAFHHHCTIGGIIPTYASPETVDQLKSWIQAAP